MKRIWIGLLVLSSCVSCLTATSADDLAQSGVHEWSLEYDGRTRSALVFAPSQVSRGRKLSADGAALGLWVARGCSPIAFRA